MEKQYTDDTFLARWISGDLSDKELDAFKKSEDYKRFEKINEGSQKLTVPAYNKEGALNKLREQLNIQKEESKVIKLIPSWVYSAAAVLVIAFGIFFFINNSSSHYQTGFSEQLAVTLPDNSKVQLNANSQLDFNSKTWKEQREVRLVGEAFFDVEKGMTFKVITSVGTIEVLGTEFNVIARQAYFEVQCHEGRVQVKSSSNEVVILTPGKAFRIANTEKEEWTFTETNPTWLQGETTFKNAPLKQVIQALENQFKVSFDVSKIDTKQKFTGGFPHKNLKVALKSVFTSMNILYTIKDENKIILVNKSNKK
ncbi:FecR family protein [Flavivirga spongiicola]|uniref:FecR domain-containing protein n=1 Tax=Flavivirga spongiicola TaxID=421621 RepID=A0ABU7XXM5_9FLAO|nr:FecR family protein [Flavivirga sp. MEBiC05379]MDO5980544.1 FecR domain-containing protein [Flavivirga sp. MEBiC05379]